LLGLVSIVISLASGMMRAANPVTRGEIFADLLDLVHFSISSFSKSSNSVIEKMINQTAQPRKNATATSVNMKLIS